MYDGINTDAATIAREFPDAAKVAYYIDGLYAWSQADVDLFPHAGHVTIAVRASTNAGDVLDVENGDASPDEAEAWIAMRKEAGLFRPTIYCSRSVVPAVRSGTGKYILGRDYDIWVADYDGVLASPAVPGLPPGTFAAKQYRDAADFDVSDVYDAEWPHRTPPAPPQPTWAQLWPAALVLREGDTGTAVKVLQQALHDSGAYGARGLEPVDGLFGPGTLAAVRNFQEDKGLTVDGIAGPATRAALGV